MESRQRLKAALHYTVGEVCGQVEEGTSFSREVVAILTETAFKQADMLATDLELFAKHAKRSTVSVEDVRLCARRSPSLLQLITTQGEQLRGAGKELDTATAEGQQQGAKRTKGKGKKNS